LSDEPWLMAHLCTFSGGVGVGGLLQKLLWV